MDTQKMCPLCGGNFEPGKTTFTVDYQKGVLVVRNVPALVCDQCGEAWILDEWAEKLEAVLQEAKSGQRQFEVVDLAA